MNMLLYLQNTAVLGISFYIRWFSPIQRLFDVADCVCGERASVLVIQTVRTYPPCTMMLLFCRFYQSKISIPFHTCCLFSCPCIEDCKFQRLFLLSKPLRGCLLCIYCWGFFSGTHSVCHYCPGVLMQENVPVSDSAKICTPLILQWCHSLDS